MKKNRKPKLLIFIFSLVLILSLLQLVISHRLATLGEKIRFLEDETKEKEDQNLTLTQQIADLASLRQVASRAVQLGLIKADRIVSISPQIPVALK